MDGKQIENFLQLIDENLGLTREEALAYIAEHREEMLTSLAKSGSATIRTGGGDIVIALKDLYTVAA